jgi:DNA-binding beta-propeller fold protein YncE
VNSSGEFQFQWKPKGLGAPHFIHCDKNDDLWISDIKTHQIHKLSKEGEIILPIGVRNVNGIDNVHYDKPTDIDFLQDGNVLISDGYGQSKRILKLDSSFNYIETWGEKGTEPGKFAVPHAITVGSDGRVYVADRDAWRIQIFDKQGKLLEVWPHIGRVFDIVESSNHHFFCLDGETGRITEVDQNGKIIGFFGEGNQLIGGHGLAITSDGSVLAAMKDGRVEKFVKN